jgi:hypothetical protein
MSTQEIIAQSSYIIAAALFILSLKWLSAVPTARRGVVAGEVGNDYRHCGNADVARNRELPVDYPDPAGWRSHRHTHCLPDADDTCSSANSPLALLRRSGSRTGRNRQVLPVEYP